MKNNLINTTFSVLAMMFSLVLPGECLAGGFNGQAAYNYAATYWDEAVSDGYYWIDEYNSAGVVINGDHPVYFGSGTSVSTIQTYIDNLNNSTSGGNWWAGDDCAHFVSSCIGAQGGGLSVPTSPGPPYGNPSAPSLVSWLISSGNGVKESSVSALQVGDVIGYDWDANGSIDHVALYLGDGNIAAHSSCYFDNLAWNGYAAYYPNVKYTFVHIPTTDTTPPALTSPTPGSTLTSTSITFQWSSGTGVSDYFLYVGRSFGTNDIYGQDQGLNLTATVNSLPADGSTLYVRLYWEISGVWNYTDYIYTAYTLTTMPSITSPAPGSTLTSSSATFQWSSGTGVSDYFLYVGSSFGTNDIYGQDQGLNLSATVSSLPTDGSTLYVRLYWEISGVWSHTDYTYTAYTLTTIPAITSPAPGSTLTSSSATFQWSSGTGVSDYFLYVGSSFGTNDIYGQDQGLNLSATVSSLPTDGSTLYVRLYWEISGVWHTADCTYTAYTLPSDTTPPTTSAFSVSPTSISVGSSVNISFTVSDTGGSGLSSIWLYRAPDASGSPGTWAAVGPYFNLSGNGPTSNTFNDTPAAGKWWYGFIVYDGAGNWNNEQNQETGYSPDFQPVQVTVAADTTPPSLTIAAPANGAVVTSASLLVSGTASDSGNGNNGVSSVTVNGIAANNDTATGANTASWNAPLTLVSGVNTITVVAKDTLNNSTQKVVSVTYNPPDTTPPSLTIASPVNGAVVTSASLLVSGTASDSGNGNNGVSSVTVNGIAANNDTATGANTASWNATVTLVSGVNTITVVAKDTLNNSTQKVVSVTYNPPDTTPPSLTIASPANGAVVTSASLLVSGTASDSGNGNNGVSSVTVNGIVANNDTASGANTANWSATVSLHSGQNTITVIATDGMGNATSPQQRTVTYNPPRPVFGGSSVNGGQMQTMVSGLSSGETVVLQASTDLKNWTPAQTKVASGSTLTFTSTVNSAMKVQFFRAVAQ